MHFFRDNTFSFRGASWTLTSCVARLSFFWSWAGFFFESLFLVFPLLDSFLNIQLGISPPWLSSSLLLELLSDFSLPVWVWQPLACTSNIALLSRGIWGGGVTHILCSTRNPGKHLPECGLPSAESLNCLVLQSSRESWPYPQSSLYIQYLVVPSLAVHSTCLLQRRSDHHYSGHSKQHCHHCWLIHSNYSSWSFHFIWVSPRLHM